jgi:hypothetical protein
MDHREWVSVFGVTLVLKLWVVFGGELIGQGVQRKMNLMLHGVKFRSGTHCIALEHTPFPVRRPQRLLPRRFTACVLAKQVFPSSSC